MTPVEMSELFIQTLQDVLFISNKLLTTLQQKTSLEE